MINSTAIGTKSTLRANGGGVVFDNKYHFVYWASYGGEIYTSYYVYNLETKAYEGGSVSLSKLGQSMISTGGIAYDKASGKGYGQFLSKDGQSYEFGAIDFTALNRSTISKGGTRLYAIAINSKGKLYAIDEKGALYSIDKATGNRTYVGSTGVYPKGLQSAAFDPQTDKLYWASIDQNENSVLYEVNTETGAVSAVATFTDGEEIVGLHVVAPEAADMAPAEASDLTATPEAADPNQVDVSFTLPATNYKGEELSGDVDWIVYVNGEATDVKGTGEAGSTVHTTVEVPTGEAVISVSVSNEAGASPFVRTSLYAGPDTPLAPSNVKLEYNAETKKATLSWNKPAAKGVNDGLVDIDNLEYNITRYPDAKLVATVSDTTYTETLETGELTSYYYEVSAVNGDAEGAVAKSNAVNVGEYKSTPFFEGFDTEEAANLFTIVNSNEDTYTWQFVSNGSNGSMMGLHYNWKMNDDDWLITPPIKLSAGRQYTFSLKGYGATRYQETFEVKMGQGDDLTAYNDLIGETVVTDPNGTKVSQTVRVDADGNYRFAIHGISPKDKSYMLYVDDIAVDEGIALSAPDSVSNIAITPVTPGSQEVNISFVAPSVDLNGDNLEAISKVVVTRGDGEEIGVVENVTPGSTVTVTDEEALNDFNTYTVVAYNASGKGIENSATAFVGYDTPFAVENPAIVDNGDNTVTITWDAVKTTGENGGTVDPSLVDYDIYIYDANAGDAVGKAGSVKGQTSITFNAGDLNNGEQDALMYAIAPKTAHGMGSAVLVTLTKGKPVELPFHESFKDGNIENDIWFLSASGSNNFALYTIPSDNDKGSIRWLATTANEEATLSTGKLSLKGTNNPKLTFMYYAAPGRKVKLNVEVDKSQKNGVDVAQVVDYATLDGEAGWRQVVIDLNKYKSEDYVLVRFHGIAEEARTPVVLDDINIYDVLQNDLTVRVEPQQKAEVGVGADVNVVVKNLAENEANEYKVTLYANDRIVGTAESTEVLAGYGAEKVHTFKFEPLVTDAANTVLKAVVDMASDEKTDNNTAEATIEVAQANVPVATNVTAESEGNNINVNWQSPAIPENGEQVTESFEDYEGNVIAPFGDWTTVDADGQSTSALDMTNVGWSGGEPMAYFVFNPEDAYYYPDWYDNMSANSGNQYLASFASDGDTNDDWLISPALDGTAQKISFFAQEYESYYGIDKFQVLYSKSTKNTEDFQVVPGTEDFEVTTKWTKYEVQLPEGARYFAIRKISAGFLFKLDDITFMSGANGAGLKVTGYNIYRDGEKIATVGADVTSYSDEDVQGEHTYQVTALYDKLESALSDAAIATSIDNAIAVLGDTDVTVYTVDGALVAHGKNALQNVRKGLYVVKNNKTGKTMKVVK